MPLCTDIVESMNLRSATEEEVRTWDERVLTNPDRGELLQSTFFAAQKRANGWVPRYMVYEADGPIYALFLVKKIPFIGELWYAPKGPGIGSEDRLAAVLGANAAYAQQNRAIFVFKLEPEIDAAPVLPESLVQAQPVQPNVNTIVVDLRPSEEDIFAGFRQRGRRSVRKAEKQTVSVEHCQANDETMQLMYRLYRETAGRGGFYLREFSYYQQFWQSAAAAGYGSFHFAVKNDEPIAAIFVTHFGTKGLYKDGASSQAVGNSGAAHLLQWEVMKYLKARGVESYDLHTTPPPEAMEDKDHPKYGLGQFKSGFSNEITTYLGTVDQPVNRRSYLLWQKLGERVALSFSFRIRRRIFY